ncbi:hypothetical protein [Marisediminicola senii]|uniref:hypothetical protein n=1 Tax=Marisediminicola senii TaxID=2711233 RepID=UPI0013EAD776|nr:hypothetical protein [Marisediminicola senii]
MPGLPFDLRIELSDPGLLDDLAAAGERRIGLDELMAVRGQRAWPAWARGAAAGHAFRWSLRDTFDSTWWPQGIDVAQRHGRRILAVSWYAHPVRGVEQGVRVTFVDLRSPRLPRYHHVLLVELARAADGDVRPQPVVVHAGGIALLGERLLVADTFGGLREFHLDDLLLLREPMFGYRHVLPQHAQHRARKVEGDRGMRFSFVSIEHRDGPPRLVAGEYGDGSRPDRLVRFDLDGGDGGDGGELVEPGLYRMQGACIVDGTWFVTTSNGKRNRGDLWVGTPGAMTRHRHVLPPGPEDLAYDRDTRRLWSLSEWPGRRRVFTIDPTRWQPAPASIPAPARQ